MLKIGILPIKDGFHEFNGCTFLLSLLVPHKRECSSGKLALYCREKRFEMNFLI